jgi:hypothetical protein
VHAETNAGSERYRRLTKRRYRSHPGSKIGKAKHSGDTWHGAGGFNVHHTQPRMGVRTADNHGVQKPWQLDVINIPPLAV